jgi:hypothetical protein
VEFVLHLAKCKGMVNLSTMATNTRIGRYYGSVKRDHSARARECNLDLLGLVTSTGYIRKYRHPGEECPPPDKRIVRQSRYPDVKETYYAVTADPKRLAAPLLNENSFTVGSADQPKYVASEQRIIQGTGGDGQTFIESHIKAIFEGPEIEVARRPNDRESWAFRSAKPILTYIDLQNRTREVLNTDWTDLLVIAESGAWLTDPAVEQLIAGRGLRHVCLIEAHQPPEHEWQLRSTIDFDLSKVWDKYRQAGVHVLLAPLSWWQHNRHMTLAFSMDEGQVTCRGGIYFRRRHKASRIQPLLVDAQDSEDVAELMLTFLSYLRRALQECRLGGQVITESQLALVHHCCQVATGLDRPPSVASRIDDVMTELRSLQQGL